MGKKRLKLAKGVSDFVPVSMNFSDLEKDVADGTLEYEPGDNGLETRRLEENLKYEEMVVQILCNLEEREQMVFLFQLLRDGGYQIDHGSFAKVVQLSRRQYMRVLDEVRMKAGLIVIGYNRHKEKE
jgi:hypothetical protein